MARRLVAEATAVAKLNIKDVEEGVKRIQLLLKGLADRVTIRATLDLTDLKASAAKGRRDLASTPAKIPVDADIAPAEAKVRRFTTEPREAKVDVTFETATARLEALKRQLDAASLTARVNASLDFDKVANEGRIVAAAAGLGPAKIATSFDIDTAAVLSDTEAARVAVQRVAGDITLGLALGNSVTSANSLLTQLQEKKLELAAFAEANEINIPLNVVDTKLLADVARARAEVTSLLHPPIHLNVEPTPFAQLSADLTRDRAGLMAAAATMPPVEIRMQTVLERTGPLASALDKALAGESVQKVRFDPDFDPVAIGAAIGAVKAQVGRIEFPATINLTAGTAVAGALRADLTEAAAGIANIRPVEFPAAINAAEVVRSARSAARLAEVTARAATRDDIKLGFGINATELTSKVTATVANLRASGVAGGIPIGFEFKPSIADARASLAAVKAGLPPINVPADIDLTKFRVRAAALSAEAAAVANRLKSLDIAPKPIDPKLLETVSLRTLGRQPFNASRGISAFPAKIIPELDDKASAATRGKLLTLAGAIRTRVSAVADASIEKVRATLAGATSNRYIKVIADADAARAEAAAISKQLAAIRDRKINIQLNSQRALEELYEYGASAKQIAEARHVLSVDTSAARRAVKAFEEYNEKRPAIKARIDVDQAKGISGAISFRQRVAKVLGAEIRADVDLRTVGASIKAQTLREKLNLLLGHVEINTDVDGAKAVGETVGLMARIKAITHLGGGVKIPVSVDGAGAELAGAAVGRSFTKGLTKLLQGGTKFGVDIAGGSTVQGINAGLSALSSAGSGGPLNLAVTAVVGLTAALAINAAAWTAVGVAAAGAAIPITKFAIDAADELQQPLIALSRTLQGTGTDFSSFAASVSEQAIKSPFQLATTLRANQRLIGQGFTPKDSLELNKLLADLVAASGGNDTAFNNVNLAVAKLQGRGVLNQRLITQLITSAPGSFNQASFLDEIANLKGLTDATSSLGEKQRARVEITKQITAREIDAATATQALITTIKQTPGVLGSAEVQVRTLAGGLANLKDALQVGSLTGFRDVFSTVGNALPDLSQSFAAGLAKIGPAVNDALQSIMPTIRPLIASVSSLIATSVRALGPVIAELSKIGSSVAASVGPSIKAIFGELATFLRDNRGFITEVLIGLSKAAALTTRAFRLIFESFMTVGSLLTSPLDTVKAFFGTLLGSLQAAVGTILKPIQAMLNSLPDFIPGLGGDFTFANDINNAGVERFKSGLLELDSIGQRGRTSLNNMFDRGFFGGRAQEDFDIIKEFGPALKTLQEQFGTAFGPTGISALTEATAGVMEGNFIDAQDAAEAFAESINDVSKIIAEQLQVAADGVGAFSDALSRSFDPDTKKFDAKTLVANFKKSADEIAGQALVVRLAFEQGFTDLAESLAKANPAEAIAVWTETTLAEKAKLEETFRSITISVDDFGISQIDVQTRLELSNMLAGISAEAKKLADAQVPIPTVGFRGATQADVDKAKLENKAAYDQIIAFINGLNPSEISRSPFAGWFDGFPKQLSETTAEAFRRLLLDPALQTTPTVTAIGTFDTSATSPAFKRLLLDDKQAEVEGTVTATGVFDTTATSPAFRRLLLDDKQTAVTVPVSLQTTSPFKPGSPLAGLFDGDKQSAVTVPVSFQLTSPFKPGSPLAGWFDGGKAAGGKTAGAVVPISADATAANSAITTVVSKARTSSASVTVGADINPAVTSIQNLVRIAMAMSVSVPVTVTLVTNGLFELIASVRRELSKQVNIPVTVNGQAPQRKFLGIPIPDTATGDGATRWTGGSVHAWKPYLVGEKGPEIVRFPRNGEVLNNATSERLMTAVQSYYSTTNTSSTSSTSSVAIDTAALGKIIAEHLGAPVAVHPPYGDPDAIASAVMARYAERGRSRIPA